MAPVSPMASKEAISLFRTYPFDGGEGCPKPPKGRAFSQLVQVYGDRVMIREPRGRPFALVTQKLLALYRGSEETSLGVRAKPVFTFADMGAECDEACFRRAVVRHLKCVEEWTAARNSNRHAVAKASQFLTTARSSLRPAEASYRIPSLYAETSIIVSLGGESAVEEVRVKIIGNPGENKESLAPPHTVMIVVGLPFLPAPLRFEINRRGEVYAVLDDKVVFDPMTPDMKFLLVKALSRLQQQAHHDPGLIIDLQILIAIIIAASPPPWMMNGPSL